MKKLKQKQGKFKFSFFWFINNNIYLCSPIKKGIVTKNEWITVLNVTIQNKKTGKMKKDIHPKEYRLVAFRDMSNGHTWFTKSTVNTRETEVIDGVQYPLFKVEISSTSHPFYTGKVTLVDSAGRVDKFMTRYAKHMENRKK